MAKILILPRSNGDGWYVDLLLQRGHQATLHDIAAGELLVIDEHIAQCDGCLLLGSSDDQMKVADRFRELAKPIYRHLAEVPRGQNSEKARLSPQLPAQPNEPPAPSGDTMSTRATEDDRDEINRATEVMRHILRLK